MGYGDFSKYHGCFNNTFIAYPSASLTEPFLSLILWPRIEPIEPVLTAAYRNLPPQATPPTPALSATSLPATSHQPATVNHHTSHEPPSTHPRPQPPSPSATHAPATCSHCCGWLEGGWLEGGWLEGGWLEGGWLAGGCWLQDSVAGGCGVGCSVWRIATEPNRNSAILAIHIPLNTAYVSVSTEPPNYNHEYFQVGVQAFFGACRTESTSTARALHCCLYTCRLVPGLVPYPCCQCTHLDGCRFLNPKQGTHKKEYGMSTSAARSPTLAATLGPQGLSKTLGPMPAIPQIVRCPRSGLGKCPTLSDSQLRISRNQAP